MDPKYNKYVFWILVDVWRGLFYQVWFKFQKMNPLLSYASVQWSECWCNHVSPLVLMLHVTHAIDHLLTMPESPEYINTGTKSHWLSSLGESWRRRPAWSSPASAVSSWLLVWSQPPPGSWHTQNMARASRDQHHDSSQWRETQELMMMTRKVKLHLKCFFCNILKKKKSFDWLSKPSEF